MEIVHKQQSGVAFLDFLIAFAIVSLIFQQSILQISQIRTSNALKDSSQILAALVQKAIIHTGLQSKQTELTIQANQLIKDSLSVLYSPKDQEQLEINSKQGKIIIYNAKTCSPASLILKNKNKKCSIKISLRCRVNNKC